MPLSAGKEMRLFGIILVVFTIRDIITLSNSGYPDSNGTDNDVLDDISDDKIDHDLDVPTWQPNTKGGPGSRISSPRFIGSTIKISYCSSCGYQSAYEQYASFVQEKYPDILVEGTVYPLPPLRRLMGQLMTVFKFLVLGAMMMNQWSLFRLVCIPERVITWIIGNKIYAALLSFFLINLLETQIGATGAFEIYLDDVPVWSKLQTGRLPNPPEFVQIIDNHIKFGGSESGSFNLPPSVVS